MSDPLAEYRRKRDPDRTTEPMPDAQAPSGKNDTFVIHQHHARRLHWDLRMERDGVLASWALPRGVPRDPARNHLAVHTEDHPMEYLDFHGEIPEGEYGAGKMIVYDRGTYDTEKWRGNELIVVFHGTRVTGKYALFQTNGKDWMIHRMDPPPSGWTPIPERIAPMTATRAKDLPADDDWGYEMTWDGVRAGGYVSGGTLQLRSADGEELTGSYPELRELAQELAPVECVLDGEIVGFDREGRVSAEALRSRITATNRRLAARVPVHYLVYDLLWLDGKHTVDLSYRQRRELLEELELAGPHWQTPPYFPGGGKYALQASREQGLPGVTCKRLESPYQPGKRTRDWLLVSAESTAGRAKGATT